MLLFVISAWSVPVRSLTVIDFHGARDHGPKLASIARCWGGDHVGCLPVCPRSCNGAWAAWRGRGGEGGGGWGAWGKRVGGPGRGRAGRPTAPPPQNSARVPLRESDSERPQTTATRGFSGLWPRELSAARKRPSGRRKKQPL